MLQHNDRFSYLVGSIESSIGRNQWLNIESFRSACFWWFCKYDHFDKLHNLVYFPQQLGHELMAI